MTAVRPGFTGTLKVIWSAICVSQIVIAGIAWRSAQTIAEPKAFDWSTFTPYAALIFFGFAAAWLLPGVMRKSIDRLSKEYPQDAVERLFVPFIARWALLESTVVFAFVSALMTEVTTPVYYTLALSLVCMVMSFPTVEKLKNDGI